MKSFMTMAFTFAVALSSATSLAAQEPTRPVSDKRIPIRKDGAQVATKESAGDVALTAERAAISALEARVESLQQRVNMMESDALGLKNRTADSERMINSLRDSLRAASVELNSLRTTLAAEMSKNAALAQDIDRLDKKIYSLRYGSIFGGSGFYLGVGTGVNVPTGTLHNIGYSEGLTVVVPFGWSKPGTMLGIRAELGLQSFEGRLAPSFSNVDPRVFTATAMATLNFPINSAKTNLFYVMGGGGAFMFQHYGSASALNDRFEKTSTVTKFGVTGGAGLEFHVLGATSLFVQTQLTNVFADGSSTIAPDDNRHLRWVPVVAGITLR
jgi:opacity protein-like surface antigen